MVDLIQLILNLFTDPLQAIVTIVLVGLFIVWMRWHATLSNSKLPLDAAPEVILRLRLKFDDEDLKKNRSKVLSPRQIKRIKKEFVSILFVYVAMIVFFGYIFYGLFWEDMSNLGPGYLIGFMIFMGLGFLFIMGVAAFFLQGYIEDLRTKKVAAVFSFIEFEEHEAEVMGFKFRTQQYKIIVNHPRLKGSASLAVGFMTRDVWRKVQELENRSAILYIAPGAAKLLSFELVATEPDGIHSILRGTNPINLSSLQ